MTQPRRVGLAGLGYLGRGIAACFLDHGFHVVALEPDQPAWEAAGQRQGLHRAITGQDFAGCELIIESITENFAAKQGLYDEIERYVDTSVPIVSNTSGFSITLLQAQRTHPERFAGMHWAPPAELTRFLEIIRGAQTDERTVQTIVELAQELGKEPGVVNDIPGFVANRIAYAMYREAIYLLEQGIADVETIDLLCRNSLGLWAPLCGPFRWMDITGGPALYANAMQTINPTLCNEPGVSGTMQKMKQEDRRGTATGEGFYTYAPGDAAEWQKKLREHAEKLRAPDSSR